MLSTINNLGDIMFETKHVRIWEPVYRALKETAEENGLILSDFISTIIIEASNNPAIVENAISKFFERKKPEKISFMLLVKITEAMNRIIEGEEHEET